MRPTFRVAENTDLESLVEFMRQYYALDQLTFVEGSARRALDHLIRDRSLGRIWLICDDGTPVGYIVLTFGYSLEYWGRDAFIDEFFLQASHRQRGWGTIALKHAEEAARELNIRALHLEVTHENSRAQQFYRQSGVEDHNRYLMTKWIDHRGVQDDAN